jgi:serine/threonine protein kinase
MADLVGQQFGNYRLIHLLGEGGFAEVYLAEHLHLGTQAAIKVLHTKLESDDLDKFRTEARTIARLLHPNIVRVLDFGIENKTPFLVMDYANNGSLRKLYPRGTRLPPGAIVDYVKQVANALQYAHDEKVIHRDIKPENMLLGRRNEVLLSDFGIALIAQSSHSQSTQDIVGTIAYMAPEHIQGKPRLASDQYSLGIVVYEWISGDRPFHGSFTELCTQHMFASPPPLHEKLPELPLSVEEVVLTALAKDPRERFGSVQAFATAFEQSYRSRISYPVAPSSKIAPQSLLPPSTDTIAATAPDQLAQPVNRVTPPGQPSPPTSAIIPPTIPVISYSTSEAKPPATFLSFPPATTPPVTGAILPMTNMVPSSPYTNTPVPPLLPVPKKHRGWKVAIGIVSTLLVMVLLFVLVLHFGQFGNQRTTPGSTPTTLKSPTPVSLPPKFIYVISDVTNNGQNTGEVLSAIRISDGTTIWHTQWNNESSYSQPIVVNGVVYIGTTHFGSQYADAGVVHALRASDGSTLWNYSIGNSTRGGASVYVDNGLVYVSAPPDGYEALYVLRASDGSLLWKYKVNKEDITLPQAVDNGVVYTGSYDFSNNHGNIYAFRASDGSILWKYQMPVDVNGSPQSALVDNGVVYIASPQSYNRFQYPYDPTKDIQNTPSTLYALRASDGMFLWKYQIDKDSSFLNLKIINRVLYASAASQKNSNSTVYALQTIDGSLLWNYQVHVDNQYGGINVAVINNGVVYIASQGANSTLYALKGNDGTLLWQYSLGNGYSPIITATNDIVYVGIALGSSSIDALRVSDGSLLWSYQLSSGSDLSELVVAGTTLYVGIFGYNGPGSMLTLQISNGSLLRQFQGISVRSMVAA